MCLAHQISADRDIAGAPAARLAHLLKQNQRTFQYQVLQLAFEQLPSVHRRTHDRLQLLANGEQKLRADVQPRASIQFSQG
ncbi:hypothetical protein D3C71_1608630 [compost metagenome]